MDGDAEPAGRPVSREVRRPFAQLWDLLSSEYGWTDDQILDLPLERIRQAAEVIRERQRKAQQARLELEEVKVRLICSYTVASYVAMTGDRSMQRAAGRIEIAPRDLPDGKTKLSELKPGDPAPEWLPSVAALERAFPGG